MAAGGPGTAGSRWLSPNRLSPLTPAGAAALAGRHTLLVGLVGGQDFLISADEWRRLAQCLQRAGVRHELTDYPQAEHGFLGEGRPAS
ncbi:dienelactone hydrolase family protein [Streptomyces sp. NBC_01304]|uniref:dienelactone hydrolase family protein n=1 Tax=Streptomyces sp. NBC_01304 TaxID=2903818 RepID=UPI003FA39625